MPEREPPKNGFGRRSISPANLRRGAGFAIQNGMRNHCINGHEYNDQNTYVEPNGRAVRCRECARQRDSQPHRNAAYRRRIKNEREAA